MKEWLAYVQLCVAVLLGLAALFALAKKQFQDKFDNYKKNKEKFISALNLASIVERDIIPTINLAKKHLSPNGGTSLVDQVSSIKEKVELMELRWKITTSKSPVGIYECNAAGECVSANAAACDIFGMTEQEMLGRGWLKAIQSDKSQIWHAWIGAVKENLPYEAEYNVKNQKTDNIVHVKSSAICHMSTSGKILGYYGTLEIINHEQNKIHS